MDRRPGEMMDASLCIVRLLAHEGSNVVWIEVCSYV